MNRCWVWYLSISRSRQIGICVIGLHLLILSALVWNHHFSTPRTQDKQPIAVRTLVIAPKNSAVNKKSAQSMRLVQPKASSPAQKAVKAAAPGPASKIIFRKKETQNSTNETIGINSALLQEITDSLEAIVRPKISSNLTSLPEIPSAVVIKPDIRCPISSYIPKYSEAVVAILQKSLDLPEFGAVVAKIEIDATGSVIQCQILSEQSRKNGEFLRKRLQELTFPCFNEFDLLETQLEFTITFCNVEKN